MKRSATTLFALMLGLSLAGFGCKATPTVDVIRDMKAAMLDVQSVSYKVTVDGKGNLVDLPAAAPIDTMPESLKLELSGQLAREESTLANTNGTFRVTTTGADAMTVAGEFRMVQGVRYFKLNEVPSLSDFDTKKIQNIWIKLAGDLTQVTGEETDPKALSAEQIEKLEKLFLNADLFSEVTLQGEESVAGNATNKYEVVLDAEVIAGMAEEAASVQGEAFSADDKQEVLDMVAELNTVPGKLWIGAKDSLLYQAQFTVKKAGSSDGEGVITVTMSDFDKPVQPMDAPADAQSLESAIGAMFGFGSVIAPSALPTQVPAFDPSSLPGLTPEILQQLEEAQRMIPRS